MTKTKHPWAAATSSSTRAGTRRRWRLSRTGRRRCPRKRPLPSWAARPRACSTSCEASREVRVKYKFGLAAAVPGTRVLRTAAYAYESYGSCSCAAVLGMAAAAKRIQIKFFCFKIPSQQTPDGGLAFVGGASSRVELLSATVATFTAEHLKVAFGSGLPCLPQSARTQSKRRVFVTTATASPAILKPTA